MARPDPHKLFAAKYRTLQEQLTFQFPRWRVKPTDDEDVRQSAGLALWRQCVRSADPSVEPFVISCEVLVLTQLRRWWRARQGRGRARARRGHG